MRIYGLCWMVLLLFVLVVVSRVAARDRAWNPDQDDDPPAEQRETYLVPDHMALIHEGDVFKLRKQHDVVVLLAVQPYVCPKCQWGHEYFVAASNAIHNDLALQEIYGQDPDQLIKFGLIDVEDEGPEFISLYDGLSDETLDYRFKVPTILVFKQLHQFIMHKPAIEFSYTMNNIRSNLMPFVIRLAGPDVLPVRTERMLMHRLTHPATNRVSVGVWADKIPKAVERVAVEGRINVFWHQLPSPETANFDLLSKFNPNRADVVFYFYKGEQMNVDHIPETTDNMNDVLQRGELFLSNVSVERRMDKQLSMIRSMLDDFLSLRPGHEFDNIRRVTILDDFIPSSADCRDESTRTKKGQAIEARIVGSIVGDLTEFADTRRDKLIVGSHREDFPDVLIGRGLVGLCPGMRRRMGFPALLAFKRDRLPPGVTEHSILSFAVEMIGFADEAEVTEVRPEFVKPEASADVAAADEL